MGRYIARRVAAMPLLLLAIVTVTFIVSRLVPANPLATVLSPRALADPASVAAARAHWGLDRSLLFQYFHYVTNLLHGDLGTSFETRQGVATDLLQRLPATLELTFAAMIIAIAGGVAIGVVVATRQNKATDHIGRLFALVGSSMPVYWSGLILLLVFSNKLHVLPGPGRLDSYTLAPPKYTGWYTIDSIISGQWSTLGNALAHLILPAFVLGWGVMGTVSRIVRAAMLDSLNQDYIRTARAKGVRESAVLFKHALRNAIIPALTILGFSAAYLITSAVFVEFIFSWPGVGSYAVASAEALDFPAILGVSLVGGTAFLAANLATDVGYAWANPQMRLA